MIDTKHILAIVIDLLQRNGILYLFVYFRCYSMEVAIYSYIHNRVLPTCADSVKKGLGFDAETVNQKVVFPL